MKFIDEAVISVSSGKGGAGAVHFMRAKYQPKMGPDGGDGGKGGDVLFVATHHMQSLLDFKFKSRYEAVNGVPGSGNDCNGRGGEDLVVQVPVGTSLYDANTGHRLADLVEDGEKILLLKGGRGGLGNMNFATPTRQAPDFAQPGEPGKSVEVRLVLKLLADVALVGFPNAGKSTLISRLSSARPKIADYPFTTLVPNLGVVRGKGVDFVVADIPGIIEGAHEGRGLGDRFLKHCERSRLLVFMLNSDPFSGRQLPDEYRILDEELRLFSTDLADKPRLVAVNKIDAFDEDALHDLGLEELKKELGRTPLFMISAVTGQGLDALKSAMEDRIAAMGPRILKNDVTTDLLMGNQDLLGEGEVDDDDEEYADDLDADLDADVEDFEDSEG